MKKGISPVVLIGGGIAAYLLLNSNSSAAATSAPASPLATALSSLLPGSTTATTAVPTTYGINSGVLGGNGSYYTVSNYAQLIAANPNLSNPNYQMTQAEVTQYYNNYLDLEQWWGLSTTINKFKTLEAAMQYHWYNYGCAEQRIFLPLQPPSNRNFIPAPVAPKSSGGGVLSTVLKVATIVGGAAITVATAGAAAPLVAAGTSAALTAESAIKGPTPALNNEELAIIFQGGLILNDILALYQSSDPVLVTAIKTKFDQISKQYS